MSDADRAGEVEAVAEGVDAHRGAQLGVAVMLRSVHHAAVAPHAQVQRHPGLEAVLEDHLEAEETEVKLARLGFVEDAQDRCGLAKFHNVSNRV